MAAARVAAKSVIFKIGGTPTAILGAKDAEMSITSDEFDISTWDDVADNAKLWASGRYEATITVNGAVISGATNDVATLTDAIMAGTVLGFKLEVGAGLNFTGSGFFKDVKIGGNMSNDSGTVSGTFRVSTKLTKATS